MAKNTEHIQHVKSNVVVEGKPKLPQPNNLVEGELAINYANGVETISIKNSNDDIVTFSSDDYYTEQKLGSGFTGENSANTVTSALEDKLDVTAYTPSVELWVSGTSENSVAQKGGNNIASGNYSIAEGSGTTASGNYSHAEGNLTIASGNFSHAEGQNTVANFVYSHAEGYNTSATSVSSHAEGYNTQASGNFSHAEGQNSVASNNWSHAEGFNTESRGGGSHAEGNCTSAFTYYAHSEGNYTLSNGEASHAEGCNTMAVGNYAHAEGLQTSATSNSSHAEGYQTLASGYYAHAEGYQTIANAYYTHTEGYKSSATSFYSHAEGGETIASANYTHAEGRNTSATSYCSHAEGSRTISKGDYSHAEGNGTTASGASSHAEGSNTMAVGGNSHAEGNSTSAMTGTAHAEGSNTNASGTSSHAEGNYTTAKGYGSHAEGGRSEAGGQYSHAEGNDTRANALDSHAEGYNTIANGDYSHAEGYQAIAHGESSHAEGQYTTADTNYSHAEGYATYTENVSEHASGQYNKPVSASNTFGHSGNTLFSVGNGTGGDSLRHNAFEIRQNGDIYIVNKAGNDVRLQDEIGNITVDQVIDDSTSASTNAVSTSAVYGFVTSYTPSITVDEVLDDTTSGSSNPVASKAVYSALTDNELVWANAYGAMSGVVSSHTENTNIHLTSSEKTKLDSLTGAVGTMAYENTSSYSSATEVNTALGAKVNSATYTAHTADTSVHFTTGTVQTLIDNSISGKVNTSDVVSAITPSNSGSTDPVATKVVAENELTVTNALTDLDERKLDATAYTPTDLSNYYTKSETSGATEISTALGAKSDTDHTHEASGVTAMTGYAKAASGSSIATGDTLNQAIGKLEAYVDDLNSQSETIAAALVDLSENKADTTTVTAHTSDTNIHLSETDRLIRDTLTRRARKDFTASGMTYFVNTLKSAIADQCLEKYGMKVGDYYSVTHDGKTYNYVIAGLNTMNGTSTPYRLNINHIGIIVDTNDTHAWNTAGNTYTSQNSYSTGGTWTTGSSAAGYANCDLHYYLTNTVLPNVKTDLGSGNIKNHYKLYSTAVNTSGYNRFGDASGCASSWAWYANQEICALSEVQVYGSTVWSSSGYDTGEAFRQLDVFRVYNMNEIFEGRYPWLRDVASASYACLVSRIGHARFTIAASTNFVAALILFA